MKKVAIIVVAMLVAGLGGYSIAQDKKAVTKPSSTREGQIAVADLHPDIVKRLQVPDLVFVAAYKKDGSAVLFKPSDATLKEVTFPLNAKVLGVSSASIVAVEGSSCLIYIPERSINGKWYPEICIK